MNIERGMKLNTRYGAGSISGWSEHVVMVELDEAAMIAKDDKLNYDATDAASVLGDDLPSDSVLVNRKEAEHQLVDNALAEMMIDDLRKNRADNTLACNTH